MNGEHQLDKQEPVMVVGADNLTLEGRGEWIAGPEENVMQSTAVINCTSGKGGFTFINSSSITIWGLTFLTCGTKSYPQDISYYSFIGKSALPMTPYAAIFVMNVKRFQFCRNSIQDSAGFGLLVYQCDEVKVSNCSFFNQILYKTTQNKVDNPHEQDDDDEDNVHDTDEVANAHKEDHSDCGAAGFLWYSFINTVLLEIVYSNFTHCFNNCGLPYTVVLSMYLLKTSNC